jgi:unsaturated chondroitin disaccharide hydrolase
MAEVLSALVSRIDQTLDQADSRYPIYADGQTGAWEWSADGGWCGGFWPGMLWLAATATGERYARHAAEASRRLRPRANAHTLLRGFLFWYGAALGIQLGHTDDEAIAAAAAVAARALAGDIDPVTGLIPPGEEDASSYDWPRPGACIDGLPGTVPLLTFTAQHGGGAALQNAAYSHVTGLVRMCVREEGSAAQTATFDPSGTRIRRVTVNGSSPESTWARAQAWALLGLAQAVRHWPEFSVQASAVADWFLEHLPSDCVCYWDFDDPAIPDAPRDTSASAIAAAALLKLPEERHRQAGAQIVDALADHISPRGALIHGCYNRNKGVATDNELIWGDYFMLEAVAARAGLLDGLPTKSA